MYFSKNYLIRYQKLTTDANVSQKKRALQSYNFLQNSTNYRIICPHGGRFESMYFLALKKIFKKILKLKNIRIFRYKVRFYCTSNFPFSKKAKNARMGSGKGYFIRWMIYLKRNSIIMESCFVPRRLIQRVVQYWNLLLPLKIIFIGV